MFKEFNNALAAHFQKMTATGLFRVAVDKDKLWETYLGAFPEGSNPIYKTRTEHDCSCCRHFIRTVGDVVTIVNNRLITIWDFTVDNAAYQTVASAMTDLIYDLPIDNVFLHTERTAGQAVSRQLLEDKTVKSWDHFFVNLPTDVVKKGVDIGPALSDSRATHDVMLRGLEEITFDAVETVLELIAQNSLYRGEEHKFAVDSFRKLKKEYHRRRNAPEKECFVWSHVKDTPQSVSRIRGGTVIGSLLLDVSNDVDLDDAVKAFESKVAPTNYKRPTALITKAMIKKAQEKIEELGLTSALERRYAVMEDITVNNILFADRAARRQMNVFDQLSAKVAEDVKKLDKVEEVSVSDFVEKILPRATSLEILFENRHGGNLVSLVAPADPTARGMFKWPNNFSWSYAGDLADSIKERVKKAGGRVDADFRCSLSWSNFDDLDLHLAEPSGNVIYFAQKLSTQTNGQLDVDMNAGHGATRSAVENIFYPDRKKMQEGEYKLQVHNFCKRETVDVGFDAEIEFDGVVRSFSHPKDLPGRKAVQVARFKYTHKSGLELLESLPSAQTSKTVWGLPTQTFHKANVVMLSPNCWDGHAVGNRHYFFMLEGCRNEGTARGFFNEMLLESLSPHRKVFEAVGAKMRTDESDRQLSGVGFSSTQRNHVMCRTTGSFARTVKVNFW